MTDATITVKTTRFGDVLIPSDRAITLPSGLLGFPDERAFCLLEPGEDACFFWLQSLRTPALAFVVTDPTLWVPDYSIPSDDGHQVFVICNKVDRSLTGNLLGPIVIDMATRVGEQRRSNGPPLDNAPRAFEAGADQCLTPPPPNTSAATPSTSCTALWPRSRVTWP